MIIYTRVKGHLGVFFGTSSGGSQHQERDFYGRKKDLRSRSMNTFAVSGRRAGHPGQDQGGDSRNCSGGRGKISYGMLVII
jgi:hypothetical protein